MKDLSWFDLHTGSEFLMDEEDTRSFLETFTEAQPSTRLKRTLANTVTSVDIKLAYNCDRDEFVSYIVGDINANPEGITTVHEKRTDSRDVTTPTVEAFLHNLYIVDDPPFDLVVSLPRSVYRRDWVDEDSWLTHDKKQLVDSIRLHPDVEQVYLSKDASRILTREGKLYYRDPSDNPIMVDGYVNLNDIGTQLRKTFGGDLSTYQYGSNAPSGVWDPQLYWTSKIAILRKASEIVHYCPRVRLPQFREVEKLNELTEFRNGVGGDIVLKGPFGTHGDEVVVIEEGTSPLESIRAKETEIRDLKDWPAFELYDKNKKQFIFNARSLRLPDLEYGHVEQAIQGTFEQDGDRYRTVEVPPHMHPDNVSSPIDFLPLVVSDPKNERFATVPSILLRVSGAASLNANKSSEFMDFYSLKQARNHELQLPSQATRFDFWSHLEQLAGRSVSFDEIKTSLHTASVVGLAARNMSAFISEQKLIDIKNSPLTED